VLICCPNSLEFPVAVLGTLAAGCAAFPISTESPESELREVAQRANAVAVIGSTVVVGAVGANVGIDVSDLAAMDGDDLPNVRPAGANARLMLLSSGSTGKPKIVCRSGDSIDAVAAQMCAAIGITSDDRILATVPLCHSYGIEHGLLGPVWAGATVHLCRGLDLPLVMRELHESAITVVPGVPAMFEMLAQLGSGGDATLSSLRVAYSAGGPLPRSVFDAFARSFGVRVSQLYGATEVGSVTYADPRDEHYDPGSVGRAMAGVDVRVTAGNDPADGLPAGQDGQVWIKAGSMFSGYLGEGTGPVVDGFFPTGDIGRLDAFGNLTITGRIKLLIDVGGLKVNPIEVEDVLMQHPGVGDCVVVAVPQSETVLRLKAVVTPRRAGERVDFDELRRFARERLAGYKVPRLFEVRESLPRTATGKLLRHLVQA
jgi:long-chain acyl-CoA synthetase